MKKYSWLAPVSILLFVLGTLIFLSPLFVPKEINWPVKQKLNLGLDLKGGMQIVLSLPDTLSEKTRNDAVENTIKILRLRLDKFGVAEPTITKMKRELKDTSILVQLPGVKDQEAARSLVRQAAVLQFKLVAPAEEGKAFVDRLDTIIQDSLAMFPYLVKLDADTKAKLKTKGAATDSLSESTGIFKSLITSSESDFMVRDADVDFVEKLLKDPNFQKIKPKEYDLALEDAENALKAEKSGPTLYVLRSKVEVEGRDIDSASMRIGSSESSDSKIANKPYIELEFTREGRILFGDVTGNNINQRLAIVVDDVVFSAPVIQDRIGDGKAIITGSFTEAEARSLAILLNNESLSVPIIEESTSQISATLGSDSIKSGMMAGLVGILAVVLFMMLYYKVSGFVADFVLLFNVGFILAALTAFGGTLTMPGIAGIILTIGMAVDANVLIFERIREELDSGKTPRTAVDAGFKRAVVTIWDANLTTLISAFVLYQFGTGPVKGFALTLTIGIIGSMFCAIVFVRYIMEKTMLAGVKKTMSI